MAARHADRDGDGQARPEGAVRPARRGRTASRRDVRPSGCASALEELGPTFSKLGQVLSTRPDLLPPEFIEELATLQDHVPPLTEEQVVRVMEQELGVPWEDVFETIEPKPLAAGTIGAGAPRDARERRARRRQGAAPRRDARRSSRTSRCSSCSRRRSATAPALKQVIDMQAVFEHLSESLHRELDFRAEAANIERMREVIAAVSRASTSPTCTTSCSTSRLLVMQEIQGVAIARRARGIPQRKEAARQLLESYYKQILTDGFFHADPHPGNLMWWNDTIYFLDFGMVGEVGAEMREQLMLLLMAFWQEDVEFLTDVSLMLRGRRPTSGPRRGRVPATTSATLMAKYRDVLAPGHPARTDAPGDDARSRSATTFRCRRRSRSRARRSRRCSSRPAQLDPELDPFDVAGKFLMRRPHGADARSSTPRRSSTRRRS